MLREKIESLSEAIVVMEEQITFYEFSIKKAVSSIGISDNDKGMMELAQILPKQITKILKEANDKQGKNVREIPVVVEREV